MKDLTARARALMKLGLLPQMDEGRLGEVVRTAESGEYDPRDAPATALLSAAGALLEIPFEDVNDPPDYAGFLKAVEEFCGEIFHVKEVQAQVVDSFVLEFDEEIGDGNGASEGELVLEVNFDEEGEFEGEADEWGGEEEEIEDDEGVLELTVVLDASKYVEQLTYMGPVVDVDFLMPVDQHLRNQGDKRRLCPIVEIMDDTARYVFADPSKVEDAELRELIAAPDFEDWE